MKALARTEAAPYVIRQDESEITLTHGASGHGQHAAVERLVLVLTRSWTTADRTTIASQRLSLDPNGRLVIEQTRTSPGRLARRTDIILTRVAAHSHVHPSRH